MYDFAFDMISPSVDCFTNQGSSPIGEKALRNWHGVFPGSICGLAESIGDAKRNRPSLRELDNGISQLEMVVEQTV